MVQIEESQLLDLIRWARRYCDFRCTFAPASFNELYDDIVRLNPSVRENDRMDETLMHKGKYWPYAQDGMYREETGCFDARK